MVFLYCLCLTCVPISTSQEKTRRQEVERQKKQRNFLNKLIRMQNQGVTDVLRKFERFMRERGEDHADDE